MIDYLIIVAVKSFKSAGKLATDVERERINNNTSVIHFGIKTPLQLGSDIFLTTNRDVASQIKDNLRNLVQTNWGERVGRFDFGANLREISTERMAREDFDNEAIARISSAVNRWMPYVSLEDFESNMDQEFLDGNTLVRIKITYSIPQVNVVNQALEVAIYTI